MNVRLQFTNHLCFTEAHVKVQTKSTLSVNLIVIWCINCYFHIHIGSISSCAPPTPVSTFATHCLILGKSSYWTSIFLSVKCFEMTRIIYKKKMLWSIIHEKLQNILIFRWKVVIFWFFSVLNYIKMIIIYNWNRKQNMDKL